MWWVPSGWRSLREELAATRAERNACQRHGALVARQLEVAREVLQVEQRHRKAQERAVRIIAEAGFVRFGPLHVAGLLSDLPLTAQGHLDEAEFAAVVFDAAAEIRTNQESNR